VEWIVEFRRLDPMLFIPCELAARTNRFERAKMLRSGHEQGAGLCMVCDEALCFAPMFAGSKV
jgi:hypothetical protein